MTSLCCSLTTFCHSQNGNIWAACDRQVGPQMRKTQRFNGTLQREGHPFKVPLLCLSNIPYRNSAGLTGPSKSAPFDSSTSPPSSQPTKIQSALLGCQMIEVTPTVRLEMWATTVPCPTSKMETSPLSSPTAKKSPSVEKERQPTELSNPKIVYAQT